MQYIVFLKALKFDCGEINKNKEDINEKATWNRHFLCQSVLLIHCTWTPCDVLSEIKHKESIDMGILISSYNRDL